MHNQITIFNKNLDLEIGSVYVIFNNHISQQYKLENSKKILYINLPYQNSVKISEYIENKDLSINLYKALIEKYNLEFIKPRIIIDVFNQLTYAIINEIDNYDILVVGTMGLSFESVKLILQEITNIAKDHKKIFILVQETSNSTDVLLEKVNELKLEDFDNWYINNSKDNNDVFSFKQI